MSPDRKDPILTTELSSSINPIAYFYEDEPDGFGIAILGNAVNTKEEKYIKETLESINRSLDQEYAIVDANERDRNPLINELRYQKLILEGRTELKVPLKLTRDDAGNIVSWSPDLFPEDRYLFWVAILSSPKTSNKYLQLKDNDQAMDVLDEFYCLRIDIQEGRKNLNAIREFSDGSLQNFLDAYPELEDSIIFLTKTISETLSEPKTNF